MRLALTEGCRLDLGWLERRSDVEPEIRDGIAAAKLIAATEAAAEDRNQIQDYVTAMVALIEAVREIVPAQTFVEIGHSLARNPILESLATGPSPVIGGWTRTATEIPPWRSRRGCRRSADGVASPARSASVQEFFRSTGAKTRSDLGATS